MPGTRGAHTHAVFAISTEQVLRALSAVNRRFERALPRILPRSRAGDAIGDNLHRPTTLLFSRPHTGRIYAGEIEPSLERVFRAADGQRPLEKITESAGIAPGTTRNMLALLPDIGAIQNSQ